MKKDIEDASLDDLEAAAGARGAFETLAWAAGVNQNWGKGADILVGAIPVAGNLNGLFDLGESVIRNGYNGYQQGGLTGSLYSVATSPEVWGAGAGVLVGTGVTKGLTSLAGEGAELATRLAADHLGGVVGTAVQTVVQGVGERIMGTQETAPPPTTPGAASNDSGVMDPAAEYNDWAQTPEGQAAINEAQLQDNMQGAASNDSGVMDPAAEYNDWAQTPEGQAAINEAQLQDNMQGAASNDSGVMDPVAEYNDWAQTPSGQEAISNASQSESYSGSDSYDGGGGGYDDGGGGGE